MTARMPLAGPVELKDNVAAGFAVAAEAYDVGGTEFSRPVGQWLVESAQVPAGAWVLDAGCGGVRSPSRQHGRLGRRVT
jgi:hypothetical protein